MRRMLQILRAAWKRFNTPGETMFAQGVVPYHHDNKTVAGRVTEWNTERRK